MLAQLLLRLVLALPLLAPILFVSSGAWVVAAALLGLAVIGSLRLWPAASSPQCEPPTPMRRRPGLSSHPLDDLDDVGDGLSIEQQHAPTQPAPKQQLPAPARPVSWKTSLADRATAKVLLEAHYQVGGQGIWRGRALLMSSSSDRRACQPAAPTPRLLPPRLLRRAPAE